MSAMHREASLSAKKDLMPKMVLDSHISEQLPAQDCRWPLVVFYNILDVSAYNIFVLWHKFNSKWNEGKLCKCLLFLEELGKALIAPKIQRLSCPSSSGCSFGRIS